MHHDGACSNGITARSYKGHELTICDLGYSVGLTYAGFLVNTITSPALISILRRNKNKFKGWGCVIEKGKGKLRDSGIFRRSIASDSDCHRRATAPGRRDGMWATGSASITWR